MKNKIATLFLALNAFLGIVQARFYLGIEGGYISQALPSIQEKGKGIEIHSVSTRDLGDLIKDGAKGYGVGIVLGTESFLTRYFGLRWGFGAGYSSAQKDLGEQAVKTLQKIDAIYSNLSADIMINFFNNGNLSFGIFGGASVEYQYFKSSSDPKWHALGFDGRAGVSTLFGGHHRTEIFAKLPFAEMSAKFSKSENNLLAYHANKVNFGASYKLLF